jgi:two-component system, NarL family, sensor kinase
VSQVAVPPGAQEIGPATSQLIDRACTEVRRISHNMMPAALVYAGLPGALDDLADQVRANQIGCVLEIVGDLNQLSATRTMGLYRIVQELVNNMLKHAKAQQVLLQLICHQDQLVITVEDDGQGFDPEAAQQQRSLGLKSIDSRVRYLQGEWEIDTVQGEGTTITIRLPLHT